MADTYRAVGKTEIRKDAWSKVSGKAAFTADISGDSIKHGYILRSIHDHAQILNIDKTQALVMPEVYAVLTADDIPGEVFFGGLIPDQPSLAKELVRHIGEPIALIIADTKANAQLAAEKINVDYKPLEAVFDPKLASLPDAPKIHGDSNLVSEIHIEEGDVSEGFDDADFILEDIFYLPRISPGYLEPEASRAQWHAEKDNVTVWVSSQHPFTDRDCIAAALGLPKSAVQVISSVIGGAFGGKEDSSLAILAALGAQAAKSSVSIINTRRESFIAHPKRHPAQIKFKLAAKNDGTFTALEAEVFLDTGAYASYGPAVAMILTETLSGSYRIPNVKIDTYLVYTNSPLSGAMRGFGSPQSHFAVESMVDMMASEIGLDPVKLRKKNALNPGDKLFTRVELNDTAIALQICLEKTDKVLKTFREVKASPGKEAGVGMALAIQSMGLGANIPDDSTHRLSLTPNGVKIDLGSPDLGQGLATAAEQITAEALGLPFEQVTTRHLDTHYSPNGNVTCASRMTFMVGNALIDASKKLVKSLLSAASAILGEPEESLSYDMGNIVKLDGTKVPAFDIAAQLKLDDVTLQSESTYSFPYPEETTPQHLPIGMPHTMFCFGAQVARVEVDPELGTVDVTHFSAIHDVGKIISQSGVEGQIEGGVATGLGYALYETMLRKEDQWVDSFTEYLLPTAMDLPPNYENIILEVKEASGPYGAKGIGEITLVPTAPAVANAVFDAVNVRIKSLPITAEKVLGLD